MITNLRIQNYKSVYDETIELGRFNVFIGENGSGKTNILEALAMASAAAENKLSNDELVLKGIRVAKPNITFSSFLGEKQSHEINIEYKRDSLNKNKINYQYSLTNDSPNKIFSPWKSNINVKSRYIEIDERERKLSFQSTEVKEAFNKLVIALADSNSIDEVDNTTKFKIAKTINNSLDKIELHHTKFRKEIIKNYKIFSLSTQILRGIGGISREIPGIHGENLDRLIESFDKDERQKLQDYAYFISWLDKIEIDKDDSHKSNGHKLDMSTSILYFRDRFMQRKNNLFSAENANEGVLHILFYLALFISKHTSKFFAIDNIETALNPELCKKLIEQLVKLAKETDRQVLITTHSPAVLDGLNLHDDEQRLFKVYRSNKGHTKVKRIQLKPDQQLNGQGLKLSELWMRNYLGAIPQNL